MSNTQFHTKQSGEKLAYTQHKGKAPHVVFLPGFKSDMTGSKAMAVDAWCKEQGLSYTRFDYRGHGESDGEFLNGCISDWLEDTLDVLESVVAEPCIIVGSSMGGWLALLAAIKKPGQINALIGIAPAPDFTERLVWNQLPEELKQEMVEKGVVYLPSCSGEEDYAMTHKLIEDGRKHLIMDEAIRKISCPIRILHGMEDNDVPWQTAHEIAQKVSSTDVEIHYIKNAGHRMSELEQLDLLTHTLSLLVR